MRRRGPVGLVLVLVMVAAACGERGPDPSGGLDQAVSGPTTTAGIGGPGGAAGAYGTLDTACGPNEGGGTVPTGDEAETLGATDDTIKVGTVSDPGFEGRPGLNIELHDAATAFVAWCNEAGGINGKQIDLTLYDAAINQYQPELERACGNEFALVGSGAVQDNLWADIGVSCDLIDFAAFSVTPEKAGQTGDDPLETRTIQSVPNPSNELAVAGSLLLQDEFPDAAGNTAVLTADLATLTIQGERITEGWESSGHTVVHTDVYNILGEANWTPFATSLRNADVEFLTFVGEGENLALLQNALQGVDFRPEVTYQEANFYAQSYIAAAGEAAEGTFVRLAIWPFEEADQNPATQLYLDTVESTGGAIAGLGVQATSAWLLFAEVAAACDREDNLTRTCVLEGGAATTEWDGGGLHTLTSPGTNEGPSCAIVMQVDGGAFVRHAPTDEDYSCPQDAVVELTGDYSSSG